MKKLDFSSMKGGWFIGNFTPSAFQTNDFEVGYAKHKKGDFWEKHYHKIATEITLIVKGKVKIDDKIYSAGEILIVYPNEVVDPEFLEDVEFMIIKVPSDVQDKYILEK